MRGALLTACCMLPTMVVAAPKAPQARATTAAQPQTFTLSIKAVIPQAQVTASLMLAELPGDSLLSPPLVSARLHLPADLRSYTVHLDKLRINGVPLTPIQPAAEALAGWLFGSTPAAPGDLDFFLDAAQLRAVIGDNSASRQVNLQTEIGAGHLLQATSGLPSALKTPAP